MLTLPSEFHDDGEMLAKERSGDEHCDCACWILISLAGVAAMVVQSVGHLVPRVVE